MNSKSIQQSSKMMPSRSDLKSTDSLLKTQLVDREKAIRSPKPRTAKTNLKSRKLANLLEKPKENSNDLRLSKNSRDNHNSTNNLSQKSRNFLIDPHKDSKYLFSPSNSKSPPKKTSTRNTETNNMRENRVKPVINIRDIKKKGLNCSAAQQSYSIESAYKDSNKTYTDMTNKPYFPNKVINSTVTHYHTDRIEDYQDIFNDQSSLQEINYSKNNSQKITNSPLTLPIRKQNVKDDILKETHILNIAPNHTPQSSLGSSNGSAENMIANKISKTEKRVPVLQNGVLLGREVIIISKQAICSTNATLVDRSAPNNSTPSSSLQSRKKENSSVVKTHKPYNTSSGNLSFEDMNHTEPVQEDLVIRSEESKGNQIGDKIETLLFNNSADEAQVNGINSRFETYIEEADHMQSKLETENHITALNKIKLAYQLFFKNYATTHQHQREQIAAEVNELLAENEFIQERLHESQNLSQNYGGNNISEYLLNETSHPPVSRTNQSATPSELFSANKKNSGGRNENSPSRKTASSLDKDRESLRSIITSQQRQINQLKKKEIDLSKLAEVCKKRGIDIMSIYDEEIIGKQDSTDHYRDIPTVNKNGRSSKNHLCLKQMLSNSALKPETNIAHRLAIGLQSSSRTAHESSKSNLKAGALPFLRTIEKDSEIGDASSDLLINEGEFRMEKLKQLDLNPSLKRQLKLDFTALHNKVKNKQTGVPGLNLVGLKSETEPVGFHQEFMSRINEFSLSWRQATENERKIS